MIESNPTLGSVESSLATKRKLARQSLEYNVKKTPMFSKLFPEYGDRYNEELTKNPPRESATSILKSSSCSLVERPQQMFVAAGFVAVFSIMFAMRFL